MTATTKTRLTNQVLERMNPPKAGRLEMGDDLCPGLVLRVTEQGAKSFSVIYRVLGGGGETAAVGRSPASSIASRWANGR